MDLKKNFIHVDAAINCTPPSLAVHVFVRGPNPSACTFAGGHGRGGNVHDNALRTFSPLPFPLE